jgi:hypothetical protein
MAPEGKSVSEGKSIPETKTIILEPEMTEAISPTKICRMVKAGTIKARATKSTHVTHPTHVHSAHATHVTKTAVLG